MERESREGGMAVISVAGFILILMFVWMWEYEAEGSSWADQG